MSSSKALLQTENLTIRFGGLVAVNNFSFQVNEGELVGLIGPNGAGKTTCFNMLTGVYTPTSGKVFFDGQEIQGRKPHVISGLGAARTFQNIRLFKEMSVEENLLVSMNDQAKYGFFASVLGLPKMNKRDNALRARAKEILKALDLDKYSQLKAGGLPYGLQRKVEIARALAANPKLLLLDEPAAGMNPTETASLATLIQKVRKDFNVSILLIEHDMSLVMKICERIFVLDYGELIAQGLPAEIRSNPKVIEAYLGGAV